MKYIVLALFLVGCTPDARLHALQAAYAAELQACVEFANTRAEYEGCAERVEEKYAPVSGRRGDAGR